MDSPLGPNAIDDPDRGVWRDRPVGRSWECPRPRDPECRWVPSLQTGSQSRQIDAGDERPENASARTPEPSLA